jgi:hypothetical protein
MGSASSEGTITTCGWATYSPILCEPIKVVKPAIELVKTMPEQVTQCDPIPVKLVVRNNGSSRSPPSRSPTACLRPDHRCRPELCLVRRRHARPLASRRSSPSTPRPPRPVRTRTRPRPPAPQGVEAVPEASVKVVKPALAIACMTPPPKKEATSAKLHRVHRPSVRSLLRGQEHRRRRLGLHRGQPARALRPDLPLRHRWRRQQRRHGQLERRQPRPGRQQEGLRDLLRANGGNYDFNATAKGACAEPGHDLLLGLHPGRERDPRRSGGRSRPDPGRRRDHLHHQGHQPGRRSRPRTIGIKAMFPAEVTRRRLQRRNGQPARPSTWPTGRRTSPSSRP